MTFLRNEDLEFLLSNVVLDIIRQETKYSKDYMECKSLYHFSEKVKLIKSSIKPKINNIADKAKTLSIFKILS